eukprot:GHVP01037718.1.p1 GENE.GHVP01037718.1~~GHVP01037718.1.p1  ORF type:complete len:211 (+),score=37.22 GHVP01037718.1:283-915(+)
MIPGLRLEGLPELPAFESWIAKEFPETHLCSGKFNESIYSVSAEKTEEDECFFIIWFEDGFLDDPVDPIIVPLQKNQSNEIFEKLNRLLHPSESLGEEDKHMVRDLISLEREHNNTFVLEKPHSLVWHYELELFQQIQDEKGFRFRGGGVFTAIYDIYRKIDEQARFRIKDVLCVRTSTSRIFSFGCIRDDGLLFRYICAFENVRILWQF